MAGDNRILLIRTGGTFESEPYDDPKNPPLSVKTLKGKDSPMETVVAGLPNHERVDIFNWGGHSEERFSKDSKEFSPDDLKALADIIRSDSHRSFIITHGTDHMARNVRAFEQALGDTDKTVVFAGAMVPLSMREKHGSDGVETLRFALDNIDAQQPGVTIVARDAKTNRRAFFNPEHVEKDWDASKRDLVFSLAAR